MEIEELEKKNTAKKKKQAGTCVVLNILVDIVHDVKSC